MIKVGDETPTMVNLEARENVWFSQILTMGTNGTNVFWVCAPIGPNGITMVFNRQPLDSMVLQW